MTRSARKYTTIWLLTGLIMVLVQVIIGGVTRLTDSGLSITEWEVVKGVLPPLNEVDWNTAFEKYKTFASKQYEQLHSDMTIAEFKEIYFWEWFHRLWGRLMGLVFFFPFLYFLYKKWMPKWLMKDLAIVVLLAGLAATFGWIMVKSGLDKDNRTWVSAYKLVIHLGIAASLFAKLWWTILKTKNTEHRLAANNAPKGYSAAKWLTFLVLIQIVLGGLMAGMRAGAIHPHWPFFLGDNYLLKAFFNPETSSLPEAVLDYEGKVWIKAFVQVLHRVTAGLLLLLSGLFFKKYIHNSATAQLIKASYIMLVLLLIQVGLGIFTVIGIVGSQVPLVLGVLHQVTALILLAAWLQIVFQFRIKN